jgi:hypothetical protein
MQSTSVSARSHHRAHVTNSAVPQQGLVEDWTFNAAGPALVSGQRGTVMMLCVPNDPLE